MKIKKTAWGISTGDGSLIGVYRFNQADPLKPWHDGFRTALFDTREKAREHLKKIKGPSIAGKYPRAKVVKVKILLEYRTGTMETKMIMKQFAREAEKCFRT